MSCKQGGCACQNDYLVCTCMAVMASEICRSIENGARSLQALSDELMVATGCSSCVPDIKQMLLYKAKGDKE
jgi:bacterioferritin-associated ferredoxin